MGGFNKTKLLSYGLEATRPKARYWQCWFLLKTVRQGSTPGPSPWLVDDLLSVSLNVIFPLRLSVSVSKFPLFLRRKEAGGSTPQGTAGPLPGRCGTESDASPAETENEPLPPRHGAPVGGESNGGCPARDGAALDLEQGPGAPLLMDGSALLDDDSNQPMPVSRFFGNVELMQVRPVLLSHSGWASPADCTLGPDLGPHVCTLLGADHTQ